MTNSSKMFSTLTIVFTMTTLYSRLSDDLKETSKPTETSTITKKGSSTVKQIAAINPEMTVYKPALRGPLNLFTFFFEKDDGATIESFYTTLKNLPRDDQAVLIISKKQKPILRKKMLAYKNNLALINPYLGGTLIVFDLSSLGRCFYAPFECSIKGDPETLTSMKDYLTPDASLKITLGTRIIVETKKFGTVIMLFCYEKNSAANFKSLKDKAFFKQGGKLGQVTSGNAFMCVFFTQNAKIDPKAFKKASGTTAAQGFIYQ